MTKNLSFSIYIKKAIKTYQKKIKLFIRRLEIRVNKLTVEAFIS